MFSFLTFSVFENSLSFTFWAWLFFNDKLLNCVSRRQRSESSLQSPKVNIQCLSSSTYSLYGDYFFVASNETSGIKICVFGRRHSINSLHYASTEFPLTSRKFKFSSLIISLTKPRSKMMELFPKCKCFKDRGKKWMAEISLFSQSKVSSSGHCSSDDKISLTSYSWLLFILTCFK